MEASNVSAKVTARANELYWSSDRSVNQIADDLDLSKGALYTIIEPLHAGLRCPRCSSSVVYPNRTAKDRGLVDCSDCEWDGRRDEATAIGDDEVGDDPAVADRPSPIRLQTAVGTRAVVGGALLGAAAGLALVLWARRR